MFGSNSAQIPNLLNGIPRSVFGTEFSIPVWLLYLFGPFYGYALNVVCIHLVAFWGMHRLLSNHVLHGDQKLIAVGVATTFALLPFSPMIGLSVAGQALVLDSFLTIRKGNARWTDWLPLLMGAIIFKLCPRLYILSFLHGVLLAIRLSNQQTTTPKIFVRHSAHDPYICGCRIPVDLHHDL